MLEFVEKLKAEPHHPDAKSWAKTLFDYVDFTIVNQQKSGSNLGEPKYEVDGSPYTGPWGRPQNDGPALRALSISEFAEWLNSMGRSDIVDAILHPVIRKDLDYVAANWKKTSFDLWEEVRGHHFYTRMAQVAGLRAGAQFFSQYKNSGVIVKRYNSVADEIVRTLSEHMSDAKIQVLETLHRDDGIAYKHKNLDTATVLGVLHAGRFGPIAVDDKHIVGTVQKLTAEFMTGYPLNIRYTFAGTAIGRYPEDQYYGGNPWFLTTLAFAEWYYRVASKVVSEEVYKVDPANNAFLSTVLGRPIPVQVEKGEKVELALALQSMGDKYLERTRIHQGKDFSMDEQIDKNSGYMKSAVHLTWSYVALLSAQRAREDFYRHFDD